MVLHMNWEYVSGKKQKGKKKKKDISVIQLSDRVYNVTLVA